jgi:hypothetical protein
MAVHCDTSDEIKLAKEVLKRTGAEDISSQRESSTERKSDSRQVRRAGTAN